ncbi:hypothetical protein PV327_009478 [Microctonus hyperodae]|uniref:Uncharacterized protein n=1 Tax=Microctonus hyperodae TaxID=165561 RepID=A0AA39KW36_MICHY|nr:hypothetical protein PV327_009478 [Microctonus hyperodae]
MYLRSNVREQGWYVNNCLAIVDCKSPRIDVNGHWIDIENIIIKNIGVNVCGLNNTKSTSLEILREFGLERGMSDSERAVITPRIGWRKLTDPDKKNLLLHELLIDHNYNRIDPWTF